MVTKFTSKQHENYIPNRNMCTWIYLFTKLKALDKLFSHKSMFKGRAILASKIKWAESTSSQGHSCILMRNKEINTYNADERKYQIYWLKTVYIINSITNFDVRLPKICHSWPHDTDKSLMRFAHSWIISCAFAHSWIISCAFIRDIFLVIVHHS
jgi:hypothetical protein